MIVSLNWLKEYVDLDGVSVEEIEEKLTIAGLEVDEIIDKAAMLENFVVGHVTECGKHPNADKLSLCKVDDGREIFDVVCGAPNVAEGQKVAFAKVGAVIPNGGFTIKKAKIRGEHSSGMICAEDELGISDNHDGIMVLDEKLEPGAPLAGVLGYDDVIIDIAITPNRPDALSHIGVARDLAVMLNREFKKPEVNTKPSGYLSENEISIEIKNRIGCPRYVGLVVKDVKIAPSPDWLQKRLTAIGQRPINNVVDVTNFVLHETGQPIHAFDLEQIGEKKIIIRDAGDDSDFVTLDSKERKLPPDALMIADGERNVAIAGVMGGENSEVTEDTKNVLIESAYFDPSSVRKTAKILGMSTDASYRFERGVDPENTLWAARRVAQLLEEVAGGKVADEAVDVYPEKLKRKEIRVRFSRVNRIMGFEIPADKIVSICSDLHFGIGSREDDSVLVEIPLFRPDIEREIDVIEEIARINGYNNIPGVERIWNILENRIDQTELAERSRSVLNSLGLFEALTNSLHNEETASFFGRGIKIINPQSIEMAYLRTSLIPGMLWTIGKNLKVREHDLALYEIGNIFNKKTDNKIKDFSDFSEETHLVMGLSGKYTDKEWFADARNYDIFDLKGLIEDFTEDMQISDKVRIESFSEKKSFFDYGFEMTFKKQVIGTGGKLSGDIPAKFDIKQDIFLFDISLSAMKEIKKSENKFEELLKYPKIIKDFAFIFSKNTDSGEIIKAIRSESSKLLKNIKLFDIFEGSGLGKGKKSLAFELEFYDEARTLTDEEVDKDFRKLIEMIKKRFNAQLRGE